MWMVVDFTVEYDPGLRVRQGHRLIAGLEIDDAQAPVYEDALHAMPIEAVGRSARERLARLRDTEKPLPVRPAMHQARRDAPRHRGGLLDRARSHYTADPAHPIRRARGTMNPEPARSPP